ncbi:KamA family radical SAM protein [Paludifilum halophilum]|uniref:KamA family radical SAM protein n=1 Tax=Paludifilum halophilum TaxID=1642702 RepID=A0A235B1J7_9BACL|nr:KamA family radical SAM protein [Paludifilum halophilum]OYD06153.1 KamA family radical SAM protein [Paludifilum halophilum]
MGALKPRYITDIRKIESIPEEHRQKMTAITDKFVFRINDYYLSLIDWDDPHDPIYKLIIPDEGELDEYGKWDASDEHLNYAAPGCQHKYGTTALLIVSEVCGAYCRFCFRKRLFRNDVHEASLDVSPGVDYIARHPEINNVLLTGGDSLILATRKIRGILERLREVPHVKIIRFGSKLPSFNPMRIYEDQELLDTLSEYSRPDARIHVMAHFNHPRELTDEAYRAIDALQRSGVILVNQTPVLKGVNDDPEVLAELLDKLSWAGVTPYYFFQNRPVAGNSSFVLTFKEAYNIIEQAKSLTSGLGKRIRYSMSHSSGKIEILAVDGDQIYLKYHQARHPDYYGRFMKFDLPENASWFDDLPGAEEILREQEESMKGKTG